MSKWLPVIAAIVIAFPSTLKAQQDRSPSFLETYEQAVAKAREQCSQLWSDKTFNQLRKKIPLNGDKPTFEMLKSNEKLKPKDKPVADLAIKTLEKCRAVWASVYAMLPPAVPEMIHGVARQQDAIIAGKITFGDFNGGMNRLNGQLSAAISGVHPSR
jgi:hypothetical protein